MCACSDLNWVHNAVINMYARRRETDLAFAVANEVGPRMDSFSYAGLLNACAKVWIFTTEQVCSASDWALPW